MFTLGSMSDIFLYKYDPFKAAESWQLPGYLHEISLKLGTILNVRFDYPITKKILTCKTYQLLPVVL